jgi:transcriptional regulator with PAS, ATPase and Fis domain
VVETGKPILLDMMQFGERSFVVTRLPLLDDDNGVIGAIGFVLYDRPQYLKPLVQKFEDLTRRLEETTRALSVERRARYNISQFVGSSTGAMETKRLARRAGQSDAAVLLLGETGTGKELLAQAIHAASSRAGGRFVGINVAAVPEGLLEAEFFGVAPGAYTDAGRKGRDGKFKLADGGTLFLDEIGDMPLSLQAKLLRVLQEQEFEPIGSNRVERVDVRIIAATGADLASLVEQRRFRADLFFRLNVVPIEVPPLRQRLDDLEVLCETILDDVALRTGSPQRQISGEGLMALTAHDWPGNVRELRNVLERACLMSDHIELGARDFAALLPADSGRTGRHPTGSGALRPLAEAIADLERSSIRRALDLTGGNRKAAAEFLGISRSSLYEKIARFGLVSRKQT